MKRTESEICFEDYCKRQEVDLHRVVEGGGRTPDYELYLGGVKIIVEVKEIQRNQEEMESDRLLASRNYGTATGGKPGERVRNKIKSGAPQIRARSEVRFSGILVLFEAQITANNTSSYDVLTAMYGLQTIGLSNHADGPNQITEEWLGSEKSMSLNHNTSISAIAILRIHYEQESSLVLYHNKHAAVPLAPGMLAPYVSAQFTLGQSIAGSMEQWVSVA